jgi:hypothetical protein
MHESAPYKLISGYLLTIITASQNIVSGFILWKICGHLTIIQLQSVAVASGLQNRLPVGLLEIESMIPYELTNDQADHNFSRRPLLELVIVFPKRFDYIAKPFHE